MNRRVPICPANHWSAESFYKTVEHHEEQEIRVAAAYDKPIDRPAIRQQVLHAMLAFAHPAGNA